MKKRPLKRSPLATVFHGERSLLNCLRPQKSYPEDTLNSYRVIAKKTDPEEDFIQVANYFLDLHKKVGKDRDEMLTLQAFNYARGNLKGKPPLEKAFMELINKTGDVNESIRALRLMTTPFKDESFYDRRDAMLGLVNTRKIRGVEAFEISDSLENAKEQLIHRAKEQSGEQKTVKEDDEYVIIGGIKLKKRS